jgi:hypothetical protein
LNFKELTEVNKLKPKGDRKMEKEAKYYCKNCDEIFTSNCSSQKLHCTCGFIVWRSDLAKTNKQTPWAINANRINI